jgi:hypothetical protein
MTDMDSHNSEHRKSTRARTARQNHVLFALVLTVVVAVVLLMIPIYLIFRSTEDGSREARLKYCQKQLDEQIAAIKSGKGSSIYLYCPVETDRLLEQLVNVPGIEEIRLELPDVTDEGMKSLAAMKSLKSFTITGGRPGVGDQGFAHICTISTLEHLEMINTRVTDRDLSLLKDLPNLRSLSLQHSAHWGTQFTDAGLQDLKALTRLKMLYVSGGLASDAAIKELRAALPNCAINETNKDQGR